MLLLLVHVAVLVLVPWRLTARHRKVLPQSAPAETLRSSVDGKVVAPNGKPVADAVVRCLIRDAETGEATLQAITHTGNAGHFEVTGIPPLPAKQASLYLVAGAAGRGLGTVSSISPTGPVELRLTEPTELQARFLGPNGNPVPGLRVRATAVTDGNGAHSFEPPEASDWLQWKTDHSGLVRMTGLPRGGTVGMDVRDERFAHLSAADDAWIKLGTEPVAHGGPFRLSPGARIEGRVTFGGSGNPASGIWVSSQELNGEDGASGVTRADGTYAMTQLKAGAYNVALGLRHGMEKSWTAVAHEKVSIGAGGRLTGMDFRLIPGCVIRGRAIAEADGRPVPGLMLGIYGPAHPMSGAWVQYTETGADGTYFLRVPPGKQHLYVMGPAKGYLTPKRHEFYPTVQDGVTTEVDFRLPSGPAPRTISGRTLGPAGHPVAQAEVVAYASHSEPPDDGPAPLGTVVSDEAGRFRMTVTGSVVLRARKGTMATRRGLPPPRGRALNLRLEPNALLQVAGLVTDERGRPLPKATIMVSRWSKGDSLITGSPETETDVAGRFSLPNLWPDLNYIVDAEAKGYGNRSEEIRQPRSGGAVRLPAIVLRVADNFVAGRMVDARGRPVVARVNVSSKHKNDGQSVTSDANGHFRLDHLVSERVKIEAEEPDGVWVSAYAQAGSTGVILGYHPDRP